MIILLVEDNPIDAFTLQESLVGMLEPGWSIVHASSLSDATDVVNDECPGCVLLDLGLPDSTGLQGLDRIQGLSPNTPVVVLSGQADKSLAIEAVRRGAQDYIEKGLFPPEVIMRCSQYAIEGKTLIRALQIKNEQLEKALGEIHTLRGFIPICARCKKVRDDAGAWEEVETYIRSHSNADFSHTYCPECYEREVNTLD